MFSVQAQSNILQQYINKFERLHAEEWHSSPVGKQ